MHLNDDKSGWFLQYTRGERVKESASSGEHITSEAGKAG